MFKQIQLPRFWIILSAVLVGSVFILITSRTGLEWHFPLEKIIGKISNEQRITSECHPLILDHSHVRSCLSGKILGTVPSDLKLEPFHTVLPERQKPVEDEVSFNTIYEKRMWGGSGEAASGGGSSVNYAVEMTATLHVLINQLKAALNKNRISMLDVPCGDMRWMSRLLSSRDDIDYTGVDIVPDLIAKHQKTFRKSSHKFLNANIVKVGLSQPYDLVFSRMMLQHLQNSDAEKFLKLISDSGSKYLLTTTFPFQETVNELNVKKKGRFRFLNLEVPPMSLTPPLCVEHDGPPTERGAHYVALWKLPLHRVARCSNPKAMYMKGSQKKYYACGQWGFHMGPI